MTFRDQNLDRLYFALSDSTRRGILARLAAGETTVGELSAPFRISAPAISKHMKILERAGLIERRVDGRQHYCSLAANGLKTAEDWLRFHRDFWESRISSLEDHLLRQAAMQQKDEKEGQGK